MILLYTDSQIIDLEWLPLIDFKQQTTICYNLEEYLNSNCDIKIAFTAHRLGCEYDIAYGFEDKINYLSSASQLVFTFDSELHDFQWKIWDKCHHSNVYWLLPGMVNGRDDINNNIICWGDWFSTTARIYKNLPKKVKEISPFDVKLKYFDALLGSPKPHRDFIYNAITQGKLENKIIVTYGGNWLENEFYAKDYFLWEPDTIQLTNVIGTADMVEYHGELAHLSQIIPIAVMNETAYSIIAETDHDNTLSFFTEKIAKPIISRRLFIVFSGYNFLQNLRELGFKTFDGIIDESYDQFINDEVRYTKAFEQVEYLCNQNQADIYLQIKDIVEHNYNLLMTRNWTAQSAYQIEAVINSAHLT